MAKKKSKKRGGALQLAVLNGPNLNLLGTREPEIYGADTLDDVEARLRAVGDELGIALTFFQSNHEGALIDEIHRLRDEVRGFIVNAGGLTHTSVSL
ncbi:MAG: type II 3-dehydroquinate dehydratase, partial [Myxococcota bacterium]